MLREHQALNKLRAQFMSPYKVPLPIDPSFISPFAKGGDREFTLKAVNDKIDEKAGTRSLTLEIDHPGIIWTGTSLIQHSSSYHTDFFLLSRCI